MRMVVGIVLFVAFLWMAVSMSAHMVFQTTRYYDTQSASYAP